MDIRYENFRWSLNEKAYTRTFCNCFWKKDGFGKKRGSPVKKALLIFFNYLAYKSLMPPLYLLPSIFDIPPFIAILVDNDLSD